VTLDLLGFGLSDKPVTADYSPIGEAAIVSDFMDTLGFEELTLIGHSYGGGIALIVYLMRQARAISRLILIDAAGYEQTLPYFVGALRVPYLNTFILNTIPPRVRACVTLRHLFFDRRLITDERIGRYARYFDLPGSHRAFIRAAGAMVPPNHSEIIASIPTIAVPTLILWGANDTVIGVCNAHHFAADIPGSAVHVFAQCGHIPHEEKPGPVANVILGFLYGR
jgi:pimeloyl-ACP methyl ester carboxylesterase